MFILSGLVPLFCISANYYQVAAGDEVVINEHGICKTVINGNTIANGGTGQDIYIPTKTKPEWQDFIADHPNPPITVKNCCAKGC